MGGGGGGDVLYTQEYDNICSQIVLTFVMSPYVYVCRFRLNKSSCVYADRSAVVVLQYIHTLFYV